MKIVVTFLFMVLSLIALGQDRAGFMVIDFVKVKNNRTEEALYFYENNWKVYRDIAMQKNYIESYRLLKALPDSSTAYDLMLITEYADSTQFALREERFNAIIKEVRPNGPKLLNAAKPADFRETVDNITTQTLWSPDERPKSPKG